jgi:putative ATPase
MEPLTIQLRPKTFDDVIGQSHLTGAGAAFRKSIESNRFGNFILYGAPGIGKTSIVNVMEQTYTIHKFNATTFTVKELRRVLDSSDDTIVFVDDCYRLSANQADVLLPYLETSRVRFIGASADNPFLTLRPSLLSRCQIFTLEPLNESEIARVVVSGIKHLKESDDSINIKKDAVLYISRIACGDARKALSILEAAYNYNPVISLSNVQKIAPSKYYRHSEDDKYNYASWYQGAIQASDPDTAIYVLAAWLESGEDPRYIARRLLVSACEDAAATPICAAVAHAAYIAAKEVGRPECDIPLAHATILVATAPRNKAAACAIWSAVSDVRRGISIEVPDNMKDCHYKSCKKLGHGAYKDGMNQTAYVSAGRKYYFPEKWS